MRLRDPSRLIYQPGWINVTQKESRGGFLTDHPRRLSVAAAMPFSGPYRRKERFPVWVAGGAMARQTGVKIASGGMPGWGREGAAAPFLRFGYRSRRALVVFPQPYATLDELGARRFEGALDRGEGRTLWSCLPSLKPVDGVRSHLSGRGKLRHGQVQGGSRHAALGWHQHNAKISQK